MTYYNLLDKTILSFTRNKQSIRIRCSICIKEKKFLGHCKMGRSLPSIWSHIRHEHSDICPEELEEQILLLKCIHTAHKHNIVTEWPGLETKIQTVTTTSSILIDGHLPRIDQWGKIVNIATSLRNQLTLFPFFRVKNIEITIKKETNVHDKRTIRQYFDCITKYSKKDNIKGHYDVSYFCNRVLN